MPSQSQSELYTEIILNCLVSSLPQAWDSAHLTFLFDENYVQYTGEVVCKGKELPLRITHESSCSRILPDIAMSLRAAMNDEFGEFPSKADFKVFQDKDAQISFEY